MSRRVLQKLRAHDHHGHFRTRTRASAGTSRGTIWDTVDRCDGTLTVVQSGAVRLHVFRLRKTVTVRATGPTSGGGGGGGGSSRYLAKLP